MLGGGASVFLANMEILLDMQIHTLSAESTNPIGIMTVAAINIPTLSLGAVGIRQAWARRRWFLEWERL